MNVLLISANVESLPDPVFPVGLAWLAASLKKSRIPYRILDLCFAEDYEEAISKAICDFPPDVVGVSLRNLDNVSYPYSVSYLPFYRHVVNAIRTWTQAPVVLGGSGFALVPGPIMEHLGADFGIAGEGELSFARLVLEMEREGMGGGAAGAPRQRPGVVIEDLDALGLPDRTGLDSEAYLKRGGMGNVQTKRGCPRRCIYCTYPLLEGRRIRLRKPERVCDEIEDLVSQGVDHLFFVDNVFNDPSEHAKALSREISGRKIKVKWSCYANPKYMTEELVEEMVSAGCTGVEFGTDSAHPGILKTLGKDLGVEDIRTASEFCKQAGLAFCHSLLLGGPGETMETVRHSLDTIVETSPTACVCMVGIRIFPNTRLAEVAAQEGKLEPGEQFLHPVFYLSTGIRERILPFLEDFSKRNPTWIFPGLKINMDERLQSKLRRFGIRGPLWEYMKTGARFRAYAGSRRAR